MSIPSRSREVFDLGQNIAGVTRLNDVRALPAGTRLVLRHAEVTDAATGAVTNAFCKSRLRKAGELACGATPRWVPQVGAELSRPSGLREVSVQVRW